MTESLLLVWCLPANVTGNPPGITCATPGSRRCKASRIYDAAASPKEAVVSKPQAEPQAGPLACIQDFLDGEVEQQAGAVGAGQLVDQLPPRRVCCQPL